MKLKLTNGVLFVCLLVPFLRAEPTWVNQQGARLVIGQSSFTRQNPASSREVLGAVGGVAIAGDRLFVADGNRVGASRINNRVLIYNNLASFVPDPEAPLPQDKSCPVCAGVPDIVLGQTAFDKFDPAVAEGFQNASAVASDGIRLAVADTDNNRVLIWHSIPVSNGQPPDVVIGQPDFSTNAPATSREGMRGPQGLWIDGGRLFVADTQNSRVLIYNTIPQSSGAPADLVLGEPDFDTRPEPDLTQSNIEPAANNMLDPVSVTVNNGRLFVSDLGFNRVLVFFSVPTQNTFPADLVIGQPDFESAVSNNSSALCDPLPPDEVPDDDDDGDDDEPVYPRRCDATLSFPRFALSDGQRLFIADGGNDRILIYNELPAVNGAPANVVLGQQDFESLVESDAAGSLRAPTSLAHDGTNLYVSDPFSRRVLVFTPGEDMIVEQGIRNGASFAIHATASVTFDGLATTEADIELTISSADTTVPERKYVYKVPKDKDDLVVRDALVAMINADPKPLAIGQPTRGEGVAATGQVTFGGTPNAGDTIVLSINGRPYEVIAQAGDDASQMVDRFILVIGQIEDPQVVPDNDPADEETLLLRAREVGTAGNSITLDATVSSGAGVTVEVDPTLTGGDFPHSIRLLAVDEGVAGNDLRLDTSPGGSGITIETSGSRFTGGSESQELPPGTLASIFGENFSDANYDADPSAPQLPTELGGVQVYTNGLLSPLYAVTPTQINFQVPWEIQGTSTSVYVRRTLTDSSLLVSAARATEATRAAPGLFAFPGPEPRRGVVLHGTAEAEGQVALSKTGSTVGNETVDAGIEVTITVESRTYKYTTQSGDTLESIRDALVNLINNANDPDVIARAGRVGFFSARADVTFSGEIRAGDIASIIIRDRQYSYTVLEGDSLEVVRNVLVQRINADRGDPEATARRLEEVGAVKLQVVARELGTAGNDIPFAVSTSAEAVIIVETNVEEGTLEGGQTPPVVVLAAREQGREGNSVRYSTASSDTARLQATARSTTLCCGNIPFSVVDDANPAIPGEVILVFGSGLGLTAPTPASQGLKSGQPTPSSPLFNVPFIAADFVSSIAGGRTAQVQFVGLMPGFVGVYQINLRLNEDLPDNPQTALTIAQVFYVSNVITFPVKNLESLP